MDLYARGSHMRRAKNFAGRRLQLEALEDRSLLAGLAMDTPALQPMASGATAASLVAKTAPAQLAGASLLTDDSYEQNDTFGTARSLGTISATTTIDELVMADNHDWYRFYLPATGTVDDAVALSFLNSQGDLDLRLYNSSGYRLRTSATINDGERISLSGLARGTYYIDAYGYLGAQNPNYSLTINRRAALVDDAYEENDSRLAARDLGTLAEVKTVSSLVMADSSDWYKFTMNGPGTSADYVATSFQHAQGDLELALYNSAGTRLRLSDGATNSERVSLSGLASGTYYVRVYGYLGAQNPSYSLEIDPGTTATTPPPPTDTGGSEFDIQFVFSGLSAAQQAIFEQAADKWESVIVGDLPAATYFGQTVDDLLIEASAVYIDGVSGILGQAGPDRVRSGSLLPYHGVMEFDSADVADMIADGTFLGVILHEMGHVLGIGTIWEDKGLLVGVGTTNPRFVGSQAVAAYNAIFGTSATGVPVEAGGGAGTRDSHWRESVFSTELMTGWVGPGSNMPLSRVTVGSLADIGYTVNMAAADAYSPPTSLLSAASTTSESGGTTTVRDADLALADSRWLHRPERRDLTARRHGLADDDLPQSRQRRYEMAVDELFSSDPGELLPLANG
jgi:hypothetical protein